MDLKCDSSHFSLGDLRQSQLSLAHDSLIEETLKRRNHERTVSNPSDGIVRSSVLLYFHVYTPWLFSIFVAQDNLAYSRQWLKLYSGYIQPDYGDYPYAMLSVAIIAQRIYQILCDPVVGETGINF